jgi:hypothetical protein
MRIPWAGDVLRAAGLAVVEVGQPRGRGRALTRIHGIVVHDTVTTRAWTDARVDALLRDGRPGVPGPLSQFGVDRVGRWRWITDGRAHHNGFGTWANDAIGVEVYAAGGLKGHEESWNSIQRESVAVGCAALLNRLQLPAANVKGHRETDPRRKIDPWQVDLEQLRTNIRRLQNAQPPPVEPPPEPEEYRMPNDVVVIGQDVYVILYAVMQRVKVPADQREHYKRIAAAPQNRQFEGPYTTWDSNRLSAFRPQTPADE